MPADENQPPPSSLSASLGDKRKPDPLVHYGRHFGRTVHTLCTVGAILSNGLLRLADESDKAEEDYSPE
ncbi:hypothetical protein HWV62_39768 [Athelia sp. TMB]|nr:hypothetical protein HWV62_39768 [Athelia sp. TMB]